MYVSELEVQGFRAFQGKKTALKLTRGVNCIAGHNGTGKSTILAILGNCGELKKAAGHHINGSQFRGEYSEIVKYDESTDTTGQKVKLTFAPHKGEHPPFPEVLKFRATVQSKKVNSFRHVKSESHPDLFERVKDEDTVSRYRLIPVKTPERKTESKLSWPGFSSSSAA